MKKLLVKNGVVVTAQAEFKADVLVKNGRIAAVGTGLPEEGCVIADAKGKLVLPGAIDSHTHLAMPLRDGISTSDDYFTGTRSAACGGTTTVFDYILQKPGEPLDESVRRQNALAEPDCVIDYAFHTGVSDVSTPELLNSVRRSADMGVTSFKAYMVYAFGLNDGQMYELFRACARFGALAGVHAENRHIIASRTAEYLAAGHVDAWRHYMTRDEAVSGEATRRAIEIAEMAGSALFIAHISDDISVQAVTDARRQGVPVFAETCPQYMYFTNEVYKRENGCEFVCSPPVKGKRSRQAIWDGIRRGDISTIATDHCPFTREQKHRWDGRDFSLIPNGCAGIETMYPYVLSCANEGKIRFTDAVRLCAYNPARLYGIDSQKGDIRAGLDADIVIYDPKKRAAVANSALHGNTDHTIWEGAALKGCPAAVYSRGELVYKDGEFTGRRGAGRFVKCARVRHNTPQL